MRKKKCSILLPFYCSLPRLVLPLDGNLLRARIIIRRRFHARLVLLLLKKSASREKGCHEKQLKGISLPAYENMRVGRREDTFSREENAQTDETVIQIEEFSRERHQGLKDRRADDAVTHTFIAVSKD